MLPATPSNSSTTNAARLTAAGGTGTPPSRTVTDSGAAGDTTDAEGSGSLRLTPAEDGQKGALFSALLVPTSAGLDVTFDSYQYAGSEIGGGSGPGADGIGFVLAAANPQDPLHFGGTGGSGDQPDKQCRHHRLGSRRADWSDADERRR